MPATTRPHPCLESLSGCDAQEARPPASVTSSRWGRAKVRVQRRVRDDEGAVTAEYAIVILAAVAFAGLLVVIMRSDEVRAMLLQLVQNALGSAG